MTYDDLKEFAGRKYSGMRVGGSHHWYYPNGRWYERKVAPELWEFSFTSTKERVRHAPPGSGAKPGTEYHWFIVADQRVQKLDEDRYATIMVGKKLKVGHRRPHWKHFSYDYPEQRSYKDVVIEFLKGLIREIEESEAIEIPSPVLAQTHSNFHRQTKHNEYLEALYQF